MRSVDLSGLPRDARHFIAWNQSEGYDIPFHYDDQQGLLTILRAGKGNHGEAVCGRPAGLYDYRSAPRAFKIQSQDDAARSSDPVFAVRR